ncbi:MAG TPA: alpha/beta hydrolase [Actinoplanes sp.]
MPFGYLVPVILVGLATALALVPARRPDLLARLSFRAGVVLDELPQLALYLLLITTVLTIAQGDIKSPAGWVLVGVAILVMGGLVVLIRRGFRARRSVRRALADARIAPAPARRWPWLRIVVAPYYRRRRDVTRVPNISYGDAGRRNLLDLYLHRSRPAGAPILIHLHGGGYSGGHKNSQSLPLIYHLASRGWVCISANYRLRPSAGFRDHLTDAKKVLAWAHKRAAEYGGDPATMVMSGSSAGAHLTALCAFTQNDSRFQPGFEDSETSLAAAVCLNGYFGEYYTGPGLPSSPFDYVRPDGPPFFIAHGDLDTEVPVEQARAFAERIRQVPPNDVVYVELPGGQHAFDLFHSPRFEAVIDGIDAFIASVRSARQQPLP